MIRVKENNREIKIRVYGKRQTSDSSLRFLKISNRYTKIVHNNSHVYGLHETTYFHSETANDKRQMRRNHGHVVTSAVSRLPETRVLISLIWRSCNDKIRALQF